MKKLFSEIPYLESDRIVIKQLTEKDERFLKELTESKTVYRYLPTFLFEQRYEDKKYVIRKMYTECFEAKESIILVRPPILMTDVEKSILERRRKYDESLPKTSLI